jgi:hypothetical protein
VANFGQATADATGPSSARKNGEYFKWTTSKPHWLLAFRQSGYALLTARQQPRNPCNSISKNSGPVVNFSGRQWGIIIVVDGLAANEELDQISPVLRAHPKVLQVRYDTFTCLPFSPGF